MPVGYETEAQNFRNTFNDVKSKKIVIYGIGRYTATLIPQLKDYNIIGFMDRDPEKIGQVIYGLPILSKEEVEEQADLIIINTVQAYWQTIFARIQDIQIPVYFRNGEQAIIENSSDEEQEYWKKSYDELKKIAENSDIISFDIFDTLISRKTYLPKDIWDIEEQNLNKKWNKQTNFKEVREYAASLLKEDNYNLKQIYEMLGEVTNWDEEEITEAEQMELDLEEQLILPRDTIIFLCKELIDFGKKVFFISDMYLPIEWYEKILKKIGISCKREQIWISCEKRASKSRGDLWEKYQREVVQGRRALHIGDDSNADVKKAESNGIKTYQVFSNKDILRHSSMKKIEPYICSKMASRISSLILQKKINDPFILNEKKGKIYFQSPEEFGYCVYGPVILNFLVWLIKDAKKKGIDNLVFFARDGYFLIEDYEYFLKKILKKDLYPQSQYLLISRRVAMIANTAKKEGLEELLSFPFSGTFGEYMNARFKMDISCVNDEHKEKIISIPNDKKMVMEWVEPYKDKLWENLEDERENYKAYLQSCDLKKNLAVVDTWYYGNTQYYLSKILKQRLTGYYFAADLSEGNRCALVNDMIACFQKKNDSRANESELFKRALITESFLTAPYGMIQKVNRDGSFICSEDRENQKHFETKRRMNEGVKNFIREFFEDIPDKTLSHIEADPIFADKLFGCWFDGGCEMSQEIKDSFWSDNDMVQKREFKIFE